MSSMVTSIVMELVDRVTRPARRIQQTLASLGRKSGLDRLANSARNLGATVGTSIDRLRGLTRGVAVMGGAIAGAIWGTERLVSGVTDVGTSVMESAERLRVGTTWLQEWQYVGKQFGVGNDALVDGLKELGLRADEFVMTAGGPAAEAFGRLGIGLEDLRATGGNTAEMFDLVRSRMGRLENDAARQRVMDEIFGGQGGEQMVAMLAATNGELEKIIQRGRERNAILTPEEIEDSREYTNQMGDLRGVLFSIQASVVGRLLPAINEWIGRMGALGQANREAVSETILETLHTLWRRFKQVGNIVVSIADRVGGFGNLMLWVAGIISFSLLGSLASAALAIINLGVVLVATPVGWFLAAVVAIAAAAYLIYRNWDGIAAWFRDMWAGIQAWFSQGIGGIMRDLVSWHPAALFMRVIDAIFEVFGARPLSAMVVEWFAGVRERVSTLWADIQAWFSQGIGRVTRDVLSFSPAALLGRAIDEVFSLFAGRSLSQVGTEWVDSLRGGISESWGGLTTWLSSRLKSLTSWLPDWARDGLGLEGLGASQAVGSPQAALGPPVANERNPAMPINQGRNDVGGELRIILDSEGRPRVAETRQNGGMDFYVESGMHGVMP